MAKKITIKLPAEDLRKKLDIRDGVDGKDGLNGKDGAPGKPGLKGIKGVDGKLGPKGDAGKDGLNGKDGSPDTREQIVEKINKGKKKDTKIKKEQIEGLDDEKLSDDITNRAIGIVDQRTSFLINKLSNLKTQVDNLPAPDLSLYAHINQTTNPDTFVGTFTFPIVVATGTGTFGTETLGDELAPALTTGNWTLGTGWSYGTSPDRLIKTTGTGNATTTAASPIVGYKTYKVVVTYSELSGGTMWYSLGNNDSRFANSAGTYTQYITSVGAGKINFVPRIAATFCTITAVSIKEVLTGSASLGGAINTFTAPIAIHQLRSGATNNPIVIDLSATRLITPFGIIALDWSLNDALSGAGGSRPQSGSIFFGTGAGYNTSLASYSNFLGTSAGQNATSAQHSNFFGLNAGTLATGANNCNFFGQYAGYNAAGANNSFFAGSNAGYGATSATNSMFVGGSAGQNATGAYSSNFLGFQSGVGATNAYRSNFLGYLAGYGSTGANSSNFFGYYAGLTATGANNSNFFGVSSGNGATNALGSNFFGYYSGVSASSAQYSNFLGHQSGVGAVYAEYSNFLGRDSGYIASSASHSNFFGKDAGRTATKAYSSIFMGRSSGYAATYASNAIFLGEYSGVSDAALNNPNGTVNSATLASDGVGYNVGDTLTLSANGSGDATFSVDTIDRGSIVLGTSSVSIIFGGGGYQLYAVVQIEDGYGGLAQANITGVDGFGAITELDFTLVYNGQFSLTGYYVQNLDGGEGYDGYVSVTAIENGAVATITKTSSGTGSYVPATNLATTVSPSGGTGATITINTITQLVGDSTSIAIGRYSGTGGYYDSIALGHGVINSAINQANIGNILFLEGIYASDTQSATPIAGVVKTIGDIKLQSDSKKMYFGAGDDASIYYNGTNLICNTREVGTGNFLVSNFARSSATNYRRYYHLPISAFDPGASGATFVPPSTNTVGGYQINAVGEVLYFDTDIHSDWDGASDIKVEIYFEVNVNNTGGGVGDTVDLKLQGFAKGTGETACKTLSIAEVATVVGQSAQYKLFKAEFTIVYNAVGAVVEVGDKLGFILNLETDTSEVDDIIIVNGSIYYNTTHIGIESGDV